MQGVPVEVRFAPAKIPSLLPRRPRLRSGGDIVDQNTINSRPHRSRPLYLPWTIGSPRSDLILVTGVTGFVGGHVLGSCSTVASAGYVALYVLPNAFPHCSLSRPDTVSRWNSSKGNLLSKADCLKACAQAAVIYHLAVGPTGKSFPGAVMNVVVPTRNLLEAAVQQNSAQTFRQRQFVCGLCQSGQPTSELAR